MITCENCLIRKRYAILDAHFDWHDCPYACEYAKEQVKEEMARSEENVGDLISRQAAIAEFKPYALYDSNRTNAEWVRRIELVLEELPSAEKHGKWIKMSDADGVYWACSACGEAIPRVSHYNPDFDLFPRLESIDKTNYCPNCGMRMDKEINKSAR